MIKAKLRVRLPDDTWISEVSRAFPDATFRLLAGLRTEEGAVELDEMVADAPGAAADAVAEHPSVDSSQLLDVGDDTALVRYETTETRLYEFAEALSLSLEYPIVVREGWFEFEFTGRREALDRFREVVEGADREYELLSVVGDDETDGLLTDRQREVLEAAVREGYYEVPRECTLADLAATLDVDKSTASGVLRRGEARVLEWFLTGANQGAPRR